MHVGRWYDFIQGVAELLMTAHHSTSTAPVQRPSDTRNNARGNGKRWGKCGSQEVEVGAKSVNHITHTGTVLSRDTGSKELCVGAGIFPRNH